MMLYVGQKVGRWTILREFRKERFLYYECRCDCGTVRNVEANSIRYGRSKSCGCLQREHALDVISENFKSSRETRAAFLTNFNVIERTEPHKNNTSGHKGVSWVKESGVWRASICVRKKRISLGCYHDIRDAIRAREDAEKQYFFPLIEAKREMEGLNCER